MILMWENIWDQVEFSAKLQKPQLIRRQTLTPEVIPTKHINVLRRNVLSEEIPTSAVITDTLFDTWERTKQNSQLRMRHCWRFLQREQIRLIECVPGNQTCFSWVSLKRDVDSFISVLFHDSPVKENQNEFSNEEGGLGSCERQHWYLTLKISFFYALLEKVLQKEYFYMKVYACIFLFYSLFFSTCFLLYFFLKSIFCSTFSKSAFLRLFLLYFFLKSINKKMIFLILFASSRHER